MSDDLADTQLQLETAVDQLTHPEHATIETDTGTRTVPLSPLLRQLADAVTSSTSRGGAPTSRYTIPIGAEAVELLIAIDHETRRGLLAAGHAPRLAQLDVDPRPAAKLEQVRAWAALAGHWHATAPTYLATAASHASRWVREARQILNPDPARWRRVRDTPCPACGAKRVRRRNDQGELELVPVLVVDAEHGDTHCLACRAHWPQEHWELLAQVIEQQRAENDRAS